MSSTTTSWRFLETRSLPSKNARGSKSTAGRLVDNKSANFTTSLLVIFFTNFAGMGAWAGPTTNALSPDAAKLSMCKEKLVTCNAIIGAAINRARRAEQEPWVEEMAIWTYLQHRKTSWQQPWPSWKREKAALETGRARFSARKATTKDRKDSWSAWSTATAISFEREFEVPEATVKTATESPEDGGADVEGAGPPKGC